jgi:geranylgeranyl pyrophosphate synthase
LFPGSLLMLWVEALGGSAASVGIEPLAAALECLHNASLVHDDILDGHQERRCQSTLAGDLGGSFALLGGDGLMTAAFGLLGRVADPRLAGCLTRIGRAADDVVAGQWLDEPATWAAVAEEMREAHWLRVCRGKLALGNAWGALGAFWTGHDELEADIVELLTEFSVVSQIINDFGDLFGWAGYHELVRDSRPPQQEAQLKPTIPAIWAARFGVADPERLLGPARNEIERRKAAALAALDQFRLDPVRRELLLDFFASPSLPKSGEGPDGVLVGGGA